MEKYNKFKMIRGLLTVFIGMGFLLLPSIRNGIVGFTLFAVLVTTLIFVIASYFLIRKK